MCKKYLELTEAFSIYKRRFADVRWQDNEKNVQFFVHTIRKKRLLCYSDGSTCVYITSRTDVIAGATGAWRWPGADRLGPGSDRSVALRFEANYCAASSRKFCFDFGHNKRNIFIILYCVLEDFSFLTSICDLESDVWVEGSRTRYCESSCCVRGDTPTFKTWAITGSYGAI
jgi:hypothetical protein